MLNFSLEMTAHCQPVIALQPTREQQPILYKLFVFTVSNHIISYCLSHFPVLCQSIMQCCEQWERDRVDHLF